MDFTAENSIRLPSELRTRKSSPELVEGLHAVADVNGRPFKLFHDGRVGQRQHRRCGVTGRLSEGDAAAWRPRLRRGSVQGCSPDQGKTAPHSGPTIPQRAVSFDKRRYRRWSRIDIMFGRLNDWRVATCDDRCRHVLFRAGVFAAIIIPPTEQIKKVLLER